MIEFPTDTKATEGETVHFLVQVAGAPKPTWVWEFQGEPITNGGSVQQFSDGTLILSSVTTDVAGRYSFTARNSTGTVKRVVNLRVLKEGEEEEEMIKKNMKLKHARSIIIEKKAIPITALEKYVEMHHASDNEGFNYQFMVS